MGWQAWSAALWASPTHRSTLAIFLPEIICKDLQIPWSSWSEQRPFFAGPLLCVDYSLSETEYLIREEVDFDLQFRGFSPDTVYRCGLAYFPPGLSASRVSWLVVRLDLNPGSLRPRSPMTSQNGPTSWESSVQTWSCGGHFNNIQTFTGALGSVKGEGFIYILKQLGN